MTEAEAKRLEGLWSGDFGRQYIERNSTAGANRGPFWEGVLSECPGQRVLEVGCNIGGNLQWVSQHREPQNVYGVDISLDALGQLRRRMPEVNAVWSPARELPFRDRFFDLTFTTGVLIHQPDVTLPLVMAEIVRCSARYVLCGEYFADDTTELPYRNERGALFKRDYGKLYAELFPELKLKRTQFLSREQGWDDLTVWLFERS